MPNPAVDVNSWAGSACYPRRTFYPLSDGPSIQNRRITNSDFRPCSTCLSRSQAGLCVYTLRLISKQPEPTFERLRYAFGGDRPSQTTRLIVSLNRIHGSRLEPRQTKDGISPLAPPPPKGRVQSLPSILRIVCPNPLSSCSQGARGLSVLMRETGIFTGTTSSLCLSLRQLPDRYAIRAGRNFMGFHSFLWHRLYVHLIEAS